MKQWNKKAIWSDVLWIGGTSIITYLIIVLFNL
jgi:hypothetical protein